MASKVVRLTGGDLKTVASKLPKWSVSETKLQRTYKFEDFTRAWGFMSQAALVAEKMDHHPNWANVYNTVNVELWTHTENGVTQLDVTLAQSMDTLSQQ